MYSTSTYLFVKFSTTILSVASIKHWTLSLHEKRKTKNEKQKTKKQQEPGTSKQANVWSFKRLNMVLVTCVLLLWVFQCLLPWLIRQLWCITSRLSCLCDHYCDSKIKQTRKISVSSLVNFDKFAHEHPINHIPFQSSKRSYIHSCGTYLDALCADLIPIRSQSWKQS